MISTIEVYSPKTLVEAYHRLQELNGRAKLLAGGTDLMVQLHDRVGVAPAYLNIWNLDELRGIAEAGDHLRIGALTTYTQIIKSPIVKQYCPILIEASQTVGGVQIQNRGTLGGNIVNASPAGDTLPILAAFEAQLELGSHRGVRVVPFNEFYTGYRQTVLAPDEMVVAVRLPKPASSEQLFFQKVGSRQALVISKVVMACKAQVDAERRMHSIQIGVGSVAPTVIRLRQTEALLKGQVLTEELIESARKLAMQEVKPITDVRSTAQYRRTITGNVLVGFLRHM
ncbi:MAG: xanthine dehydrogenase family protein subunit M [candidate division KSB1 bacterium]|nr:xanthine dehydrogenase family protein subunit M [candidate division KSB1 bacterium]MDZ7366853.1 xanthine dehydrogenase family protein subunit M [candidate division KSB1 bacterium]MDZ7405140.1 xanthine dehydrogenase family protein subunit M [candidate division KSB1 bacterium]